MSLFQIRRTKCAHRILGRFPTRTHPALLTGHDVGRPPCDCVRHDRAKVRFVFEFDVSELRAVSQRLQRGAEHEQPTDRNLWLVVVQVETEDTSAVRQSLSMSGLR